ncbi:hypothetical protein O6H91_10G083900 [Diphasiastrum complanatum]|uniref:Uncharacterized protein n=1 Tax=Diphasiastrum complanatum TaxID=34168 RepID=A0ACC2CIZ1_DIPCM|nr:hypothetical protein O6H91_10G083900 [Diphasiastrum complanatum]
MQQLPCHDKLLYHFCFDLVSVMARNLGSKEVTGSSMAGQSTLHLNMDFVSGIDVLSPRRKSTSISPVLATTHNNNNSIASKGLDRAESSSRFRGLESQSILSVTDDGESVAMLVKDEEVMTSEALPGDRAFPRDKPSVFSTSAAKIKDKRASMVMSDDNFSEMLLWVWGESRHSGMACMILSSLAYNIMDLLVQYFPAQQMPSFQIIFVRSGVGGVVALMGLLWRGQSLLGEPKYRPTLLARAIIEFFAMCGFFYSIQVLPLSDAFVLNLTSPLFSTIMARIFLKEKWVAKEVAGTLCNFVGLIILVQPLAGFGDQGFTNTLTPSSKRSTGRHLYLGAILIGLTSSLAGGVSNCLLRSARKAEDSSMLAVLVLTAFSCPAAAVCTLLFQEFVIPSPIEFCGIVVVGLFSFIAQVLLTRALYLDKVGRTTTMQFMEVVGTSLIRILVLGQIPSLITGLGLVLIVVSTCFLVFCTHDKMLE